MPSRGNPETYRDSSSGLDSCLPADRFTHCVKIGQGTSGEIYSATDLRLKRTVALKMVRFSSEQPSSTMAKSQNEVRILSRIHHPSVIQLLDVYRSRHSIYLIQPFCKNGSLDQWLQQEEMSSERVIPMFRDLLEAVQFVHSCGLVHADIKPSNVLVDERCRVFLCDFELSREAHEKSTEGPSRELVGSIGYMAPELIEQKGVPTFRSDIYSLGVTLYELLAKERAFPGTIEQAMQRALHGDVPMLRRSSLNGMVLKSVADWNAIIQKATAKVPADRYLCVLEMAEDVRKACEHLPISARPSSSIYRVMKWARRERSTAVLLLIFSLCLVGGGLGVAFGWWTTASQLKTTLAEQSRLSDLSKKVQEVRRQLQISLDAAEKATALAKEKEAIAEKASLQSIQEGELLNAQIAETDRLMAESTKTANLLSQEESERSSLASRAVAREENVGQAELIATIEKNRLAREVRDKVYWEAIDATYKRIPDDWEGARQSLDSTAKEDRGFEYYVFDAMIRHRSVEQAHRIVAEWEYSETQLHRANYSTFAFSQDEKVAFIASPNRYRVWGVDIASGKAGPPFKLETERDNRSNRERRLKLVSDAEGRTLCVLSMFNDHVQVEVLQRLEKGELRRMSLQAIDGKLVQAAYVPVIGYVVLMEVTVEGRKRLALGGADQGEELWSRWRMSQENCTPLHNEWCPHEQIGFIEGNQLTLLVANEDQEMDEIDFEYPSASAEVFYGVEKGQAFIPPPIKPAYYSLKNPKASSFTLEGIRGRGTWLRLANRTVSYGGGLLIASPSIGSPSVLPSTSIYLNLKFRGSFKPSVRPNTKFPDKTHPRLEKVLRDGTLLISMFRNEKEEYLLQVDFGIEQTPEFRRLMQRVTTEEYLKLVEAPVLEHDFSAQDIQSPK